MLEIILIIVILVVGYKFLTMEITLVRVGIVFSLFCLYMYVDIVGSVS